MIENASTLLAVITAVTAIASSVVAGTVTYLTNRSQKSRDRAEEAALQRRQEMQKAIAAYLCATRKSANLVLKYNSTNEEKTAAQDSVSDLLVQVELLSPARIADLARNLYLHGQSPNADFYVWAETANLLWNQLLAAVREELRSPLA